MLYREPVNHFVDIETWLIMGHFPHGLRQRVLSLPAVALRPELLDGHLVVIRKREKGDANTLAEFLKCLKDYADEAIFLQGCRVLPLTTSYRLPTNDDGLTELEVAEQADVLVMAVLDGLEPRDYTAVNRLIAGRAIGDPKVTIITLRDKTLKELTNAIEAFEERVLIL